jgi:hypothetical protein
VEGELKFLEILTKATPKLRKEILKNCEPSLIEAISEVCYNYLRGNINCGKKQFCMLKKHHKCIKSLAQEYRGNKKSNLKSNKGYLSDIERKKKILYQKGDGFWFALLAPLVTELSSYFVSKALQK